MGQEFSMEEIRLQVAESSRPAATKERLRRNFPTGEYDEAYAQEMENHIVENRTTLTEIDIVAEPDGYNSDLDNAEAVGCRYLDAVVRGLVHSAQTGRKDMALKKLRISGWTHHSVGIDRMSKILWAAPKELELSLNFMHRPDEYQGSFANDADWSSCQLEDLEIDDSDYSNESLCALLEMLAKMSSLKKVSLSSRPRVGGCDPEKVTPSLVKMMECNPNLRELIICYLVPKKRLFCQQVGKSKALKELSLLELNGENENMDYLETLAQTLKDNSHVPLERFEYESTGYDHGVWGPSSLDYYVALNFAGRQKLRDPSLSGEVLVRLLSRYCQQSAEANLIESNLAYAHAAKKVCGDQSSRSNESAGDSQESRTEGDIKEHAPAAKTSTIQMFESEEQQAQREEAKAILGLNDQQLDFAKALSMFSAPQWARTETDQRLKDTCMLYGLLRESPGIWSAMANHPFDDMDMKPAAKSTKRKIAQAEDRAKKAKLE